jgi:ElaB/YqjD/DUF883 family membrane-anchored ribosome-binding protein
MAQLDRPNYTARAGSDSTAGAFDPGLRERGADTVEDAKAASREPFTACSDVADTFGEALDRSIRTRPYATLAAAAGIGFLFGACWRR